MNKVNVFFTSNHCVEVPSFSTESRSDAEFMRTNKNDSEVIDKIISAIIMQSKRQRNLATAKPIRKKNVFHGIMDTSNAHEKTLVFKINKIWNGDARTRDLFINIVKLLFFRDSEECAEKGIVSIMTENDVNEYLMQVADDVDLATIINFVRCQDKSSEYGQILASI